MTIMRYKKDSIDFEINMYAFYEMEQVVPMTRDERSDTYIWVNNGHDLESNPWHLTDTHGYELNFLRARRIHKGYSSGPWDSWKGNY